MSRRLCVRPLIPCLSCSNPKIYKRGICSACWWYEYRHDGAPRPFELQRRLVARLITKASRH